MLCIDIISNGIIEHPVIAMITSLATKSGRYTLEKQTHDIQEIRQLEVQARVTHGGESLLDKQQREGEMDKIVEVQSFSSRSIIYPSQRTCITIL